MKEKNAQIWTLILADYILPIPLSILMIMLWYQRISNWYFASFTVLFPLAFGYIVPGIGTNLLHLWEFKWDKWRVGKFFWHHGFLFAPYFSLSLYLCFGSLEEYSLLDFATVALSTAFLQCFLTTWHDYWAVKNGMIVIHNRPFRQGKSAAEIILDYGPIGYLLFGFSYAVTCLTAYSFFVLKGETSIKLYIMLLSFGVLFMGGTGLHYVYRELKIRKEDKN